jgi:uncharacterized membrane protein (UPF0127 family)
MMRRTLVALGLVVLIAGCGSRLGPTTFDSIAPETTATTTTPAEPTTTTAAVAPEVPAVLDGFDITTVALDGETLLVAVADDRDERQQGLMYLEDLGDLDGMLFVFEEDSSGGFWMKNTLIPLDIAFFDVSGDFVDGFEMEPCTDDPCRTYQPSGSYRYALEMPAGTMPSDPSHIELNG